MGKLLALGLGMGTVQIACLPYYNKTFFGQFSSVAYIGCKIRMKSLEL